MNLRIILRNALHSSNMNASRLSLEESPTRLVASMPGAASKGRVLSQRSRSVTAFGALLLATLTASRAHAQDAAAQPQVSPEPVAQLQPAPAEPAPAPPPAYAEPAPLVAPAPPPAEPAAAAPAFPDRVSIGKSGGFVQFSSLIQPWLFLSHTQDEIVNSTFRLRRAEMVFKGELAPKKFGFLVRIDPAKLLAARSLPVTGQSPAPTTAGSVSALQPGGTDGSILQDAWVSFITDYATVQAGQFKIPVSLEANQSSAALLFPERSIVTRAFGDRRELGVKVEKKIADVFYYNIGVYNGSNINRLDTDKEKDVGLRLEAYPIPGLTIGALGYTTIGERDASVVDRLEADLRLELAGFIVQGEYIHGWDGAKNAAGQRTEGAGAYAAFAYTFAQLIQPVFRFGFLDTNVDNDDAGKTNWFEGGINYFLQGNDVKLSLSVSHFIPDPAPDFTEITLQAQFGF
jgi:phosphate-selective porin O/P